MVEDFFCIEVVDEFFNSEVVTTEVDEYSNIEVVDEFFNIEVRRGGAVRRELES